MEGKDFVNRYLLLGMFSVFRYTLAKEEKKVLSQIRGMEYYESTNTMKQKKVRVPGDLTLKNQQKTQF